MESSVLVCLVPLQDFEQYMFEKLEKSTAKASSTSKSNFATITRLRLATDNHGAATIHSTFMHASSSKDLLTFYH
eukprot:1159462-Pelagomonas_calceolata.AAC.11